MKAFLILIFLTNLILLSFEDCIASSPIETGLTTAQKEALLAKHNELRNYLAQGNQQDYPIATDMTELVWDMELEQWAQGWSDTCTLSTNPTKSTTNYNYVGQNLKFSLSTAQLTLNSDSAIQSWYDKLSEFDVSYLTSFQSSGGNGFSQIIWANTKKLGCGYRQDYNGSYYIIYLTCAYYPSGNYLNSQVYAQGATPASSCNNGVSTSYSSLCANADTSDFGGTANANCHYTCGTGDCSGSNINECTACNQSKHREFNNNECVCLDGYFDDGTNEMCQSCHHSCFDTNKCLCQTDYVDDGANELCIASGCVSLVEKGLSLSQKEGILHYHNYYRNLVASGQQSGQPGATKYGFQVKQAFQYESDDLGLRIGAIGASLLSFSSSSINPFVYQSSPVIGHYTQVAWANSDRVGCGYYKENQTATSTVKIYLICNYYVPGNLISSPMYLIADTNNLPGSQCSALDTTYTTLCANSGTSDFGGTSSCDSTCLTCSGPSATECTSCQAASYLSGATVGSCLPCHYSCKTCSGGLNTNCLTCDEASNWLFVAASNTCICKDGFTEANNACVACHYSCSTCNGPLSTNCLTCSSDKFRVFDTNQCPCQTDYIDDGANELCITSGCVSLVEKGLSLSQKEGILHYHNYYRNLVASGQQSGQPGATKYGFQVKQVFQYESDDLGLRIGAIGASLLSFSSGSINPFVYQSSPVIGHYTQVAWANSDRVGCGYYKENQTATSTVKIYLICNYYVPGNLISSPMYLIADTNNLPGSQCSALDSTYTTLCANSGTSDFGGTSSCDSTCLTCSGPSATECTSCQAASYLSGATVGSCLPCHYSCKTCSGGLNTNCLTCDEASNWLFVAASNTCVCKEGFFEANNVCNACHHSCLTCSGDLESQCLTCPSDAFRTQIDTTYCKCNDGYYDNGAALCLQCPTSNCLTCPQATCSVCQPGFYVTSSNTCSACHPACNTCSGPADNQCTSCKVAINLIPDRTDDSVTVFKCKCSEDHKFINSQGICESCHHSWFLSLFNSTLLSETCSGSGENQCVTCLSANFRELTQNTYCSCLTGYFNSGTQPACLPCHLTCATCNGPNENNCLTCNTATQNRVDNAATANSCPCAIGYYQDSTNPVCQPCHYSCKTCSGDLNTNCLTCDETKDWLFVAASNTCVCKEGFFEANNVCNACHHSCLTCSGDLESQCLTCPSDAFREQVDTSYCKCIDGYFDNGVKLCSQCQISNCLQCTQGVCDTCESGFYLTSAKTCSACHPSCKTCQGAAESDCNSCETNNNLIPDRTDDSVTVFKCKCTEDHKFVNSQGICESCHHSCETCSGSGENQCVTCLSANFRELTQNTYCSCLTGYFNSGTQPACLPCHLTCATCNGPNENNCLTCNAATQNRVDNAATANSCPCAIGYYQDSINPVCQPCHYSCKTCSGDLNTNCLTCDETKDWLFVAASNTCVCKEGFFEANNVCNACHHSCLTCSGDLESQCLTCPSDAFREQVDTSYCKCIDGYFDNGVKLCSQCQISNCLQCTQGVCDTCESGFYLTSAKTCSACHPSCKTCQGAAESDCNSCETNNNLIPDRTDDSVTVFKCKCTEDHKFVNSQGICESCHHSCETCSGSGENQCVTCLSANFRELTQNTYCSCLTGYFNSGTQPACLPCHLTCATCNGPNENNCLTCNAATQNRVDNAATANSCPCAIGYYQDSTNPVCQPCHYSCKTCSGDLNTNCLTCDETKDWLFVAASNTCVCKEGFFEANNVCNACHHSCLTCSGDLESQCLTCPSDAFREQVDTSYCKCIDGYFDNGVQLCSGCQTSNCLQCTQGVCDTCESGFYLTSAKTCSACHPSCKTCQGAAESDCNSCETNNNLIPDRTDDSVTVFKCKCTEDHKFINSQGICESCHHSWFLSLFNSTLLSETCSGSGENQCVTCLSANFRELTQNTYCSCLTGYFNSGTQPACLPCHLTCATCNGPNENNCLTCNTATQNRVDNAATANSCPCAISYYQDSTNPVCQPCHYSCKTCSGDENTNCLTCDETKDWLFVAASNTCVCKEGFFEANNVCNACHHSCLTCSGDLESQCLTCPSDAFREQVDTSYCKCNEGYYDNGVQLCNSCPGTNCLQCPQGICDTCQLGYYLTSAKTCSVCHPSCKTCQGATENDCNSCETNNNLIPDRTDDSVTVFKCKCTEDHKFINSQGICESCHHSCETCSGSGENQCVTCLSANFRELTQNTYCSCLTGYFNSGTQPACLPCHLTCATCNGPNENNCLTCNTATQNRVDNAATASSCPCAIGYYQDSTNPVCQPCHYSCKTCSGGLNTNCLTCDETKDWLFVAASNTCVCKEGFFEANNVCNACDQTCETCSESSTHCLTCNSSLHREFDSATNQCDCAQNYQDNGNALCIPDSDCHYTCMSATCTDNSETSCLTCDSTKHRTYDALEKKCICDIGYYDDQLFSEECFQCSPACAACVGPTENDCLDCHSTCKTCSKTDDRQACSSCDSAKFRMLDGKECVCVNGYYEDLNFECVQATSCPSGYVGILKVDNDGASGISGNICGRECVNGAFLDQTSNVCSLYCDSSCATCSSPANNQACTKCKSATAFLSSGECLSDGSKCKEQGKIAFNIQRFSTAYLEQVGYTSNQCLQSCPKGSALNSTTNECNKCADNCQTCSVPLNPNKCLAINCPSGQFQRLIGSSYTCVDSCNPEGEYLDQATLQCRQCEDTQNCLICAGPGENCTECKEGYELLEGVCNLEQNCQGFKILIDGETQCVDACPSEGYYTNRSAKQCQNCDQSCKTCSAPNDSNKCSTCSNFMYYSKTLGTCSSTCPESTYSKVQDGTNIDYQCYDCDKGCKDCKLSQDETTNEEKLICSACDSGYYLSEQTCVKKCPDGFYGDSATNLCQACSSSCLKCSGGSDSECTKCPENTVLSASNAGKSGVCKQVEALEDDYQSDEQVEKKVESITTASVYQVTTEFTQTIQQSQKLTTTQKITTAKKITAKIETMVTEKESLTEQESSDILNSASSLASDTTIATKTVMTSLVKTVTQVVKKVKITTSDGVTQIISSLSSIVSTTKIKSTTTSTTTTTTTTANNQNNNNNDQSTNSDDDDEINSEQQEEIINNVKDTMKSVKTNVATNFKVNQKVTVETTEMQFEVVKLDCQSTEFIQQLEKEDDSSSNSTTGVKIKVSASFQQKIQTLTSTSVTLSKQVWKSTNPYKSQTKQKLAADVSSIDLLDDEGNELQIDNLEEPVELQLKKTMTVTSSVEAVYYNKVQKLWKRDGVIIEASSSASTQEYFKMKVYHFTDFTIMEIEEEDKNINFAILTSTGSIFIILIIGITYYLKNKIKVKERYQFQQLTISPYYSIITSQKTKEFLIKIMLLLAYYTHFILGMTLALIIQTNITTQNAIVYCSLVFCFAIIMKYSFGTMSFIALRLNVGVTLFTIFICLYYGGITCFSLLQLNSESYDNQKLWLLSIIFTITFDIVLDCIFILIMSLIKISKDSKIWRLLSYNGFVIQNISQQIVELDMAKQQQNIIVQDMEENYVNVANQFSYSSGITEKSPSPKLQKLQY